MTGTVAITGSGGFLGVWLTRALRASGTTVVPVLRPRRADGRRSRPSLPSAAVVTDGTSTPAWVDAGVPKVDTLVHLAAYMPRSAATADDARENFQGNAVFTQRLLDALPEPPSRIIHASTVDVYCTQPRGTQLTEESAIGPRSFHGASKLLSERLMRAYCAAHPTTLLIARLAPLYGPGEPDSQKLVPTGIATALAGEPPQILGDPQARRDLLHVSDAAEALRRMVRLDSDAAQMINIASGRSAAVVELLSLVADLAGAPPPKQSPEPRAASWSIEVDASHMRSTLGAWPLVMLSAGLAEEIAARRADVTPSRASGLAERRPTL